MQKRESNSVSRQVGSTNYFFIRFFYLRKDLGEKNQRANAEGKGKITSRKEGVILFINIRTTI